MGILGILMTVHHMLMDYEEVQGTLWVCCNGKSRKTHFLSVITLRLIRTKKTHTGDEIESLTEDEDHSHAEVLKQNMSECLGC